MNMKSKDQPTDRPDDGQILAEENVTPEPVPSRPHWKERFKAILQKIFLIGTTLARKAKSVFTGMIRVEGGVSPPDDIKGAFRHIPLKKKVWAF
jgi:hypothetical protein